MKNTALSTKDKIQFGSDVRTITTLEIAEMMEISHRDILNKLCGTRDKDGKVKQVGIIPVLTEANFRLSDYFVESTYRDTSGKENSSSMKSLTGRGNTEDYKLTAHFAKKLSTKGNGAKAELGEIKTEFDNPFLDRRVA